MTARRRKVAIVTGGRSSEHEIALASASSVTQALDPDRYEVVTVEIGRDGTWALEAGSPGHAPGYIPSERVRHEQSQCNRDAATRSRSGASRRDRLDRPSAAAGP